MINTSFNLTSVNNVRNNSSDTQKPSSMAPAQQTCSENLKYLNNYYMPKINFCGQKEEAVDKSQIQEKINRFLSSQTYTFKIEEDGEEKEFIGTIKDYLEKNIVEIKEQEKYSNLLHGTSCEARENIIENGFDSDKISRTLAGPGTCFTGSEYEAHQLGGGALIECCFEGNVALVKHGYYDKILYNQKLCDQIDQLADVGISKLKPEEHWTTKHMQKMEEVGKYIGEYVRHVLIDEMGIDAANDPGKAPCYPSCFVVFNTDAIKNIHGFN